MQAISQIEKLWIQKTIESKGYCWFNNSFLLDLLIMNGEYYNKHFIGIKTDRTWEDECPTLYFEFADDQPITITVCEEDGSEYSVELTKEEHETHQQEQAVDNQAFIWVKQPQVFDDVYKMMGKKFDFDEFEKTANQPFASLEELISNVENWLDEYGSTMMKLIKIVEAKNEKEQTNN